MTKDESLAELRLLRDGRGGEPGYPKTFREFHRRVTDAMGRDVWTHEMANMDALIAERESGREVTFDEICAKVPPEKLVVVELSSPGETLDTEVLGKMLRRIAERNTSDADAPGAPDPS